MSPMRLLLFILCASLLCTTHGHCSSSPEKEKPKLTLGDCVLLALKNNFDVQKLYLGRIPQRYGLKAAEDKFNPTGSLVFSTQRSSTYQGWDTGRTNGNNQTGSFTTTMNVITGGNFNFSWNGAANRADVSQNYYYNPTWSLQFTQPLLKNAGVAMATASIQIARIGDETNLLGFRNTLMGIINSVVATYRTYLSSLWSLEISRQSLETAKQIYETNKATVEAGRMAKMDIVQTETNIANSELGLLQAENTVDQGRLALIMLLNIDKDTVFEPVKEEAVHPIPPTLEEALSIAFQNRPDYLAAVKTVETATINLAVAGNNRLWDLSLSTGASSHAGTTHPWETAISRGTADWSAGLTLTIPLRDLSIEQTYLSSKIALEQSKIDLKKSRLTIELDLKNTLRNVEMSLKQMKKAKQARELAERQYSVEKDKYKAGRSTNFQLVSYQNSLVAAQQSEVSSLIDYLNSLTALDTSLGTTLSTWNIEISKDSEPVRRREAEAKRGQTPE
jgi:outer membrane protein TolC